jgi:hypothetical protein
MESSTYRIHYHCNFLVDEISSWSQRRVFGIATRLRSGQQRIRSYIYAGKEVFIIFRPSKTFRGAVCLLLSGHRLLLPRDKATGAWTWPPIYFFDEVKNELQYTATRIRAFVACAWKSVHLYQIGRGAQTFQKSTSHPKIVGTKKMVTQSKFHTENSQILGSIINNAFIRVTWRPELWYWTYFERML